ncbi:M23 family metallopeptidase [Arthrobacter sp. I2-34]|uniref:M23 family metallopeptidase n=1 Tax=Arthrobacter hankyongi TaxID=2904801 RepID=A0ABS9L3G7_9MICC|nr:M23 family metallopeptidase [Arthrobacter hankyongi]MCG2621037.1 M23 family metallopeptidase [Arthrobacter hankyongi]
MSEHKASGRRRSSAPAASVRPHTGQPGRRRAAEPVRSPFAAAVHGLGHKAALVAAVSGMALTVVLPTTAGAAGGSGAAAPSTAVTAAAQAKVDYQRSGLTSGFDPDTKLEQLMVASGAEVEATSSKGTLSQPMDAMKMTSPFGMRINPVTGAAGEMHTGQDYGVPCGTPVHAAAGGTIKSAGWVDMYGNRVVIDHGNGLETTYNHLTSIGTHQGAKVSRGDLIAESGTTGNSTGCHLHFEVVVGGKMVDPKSWL